MSPAPRWPLPAVAAVLAVSLPLSSLSHDAGLRYAIAMQQGGARQSPPLELLHFGQADITLHRLEGGEQRSVTVLTDSVLFRQGDQYLLADQATFVDKQEEVRLRGRVRGWDPSWKFWADDVIYRGKDRTIIATGNVQSESMENGSQVTARQVRFDRNTGEGVATGSPYLYQPPGDSTEAATEVIGSDGARLRFRRDAGWAEISGGAEVVRGEVSIRGNWLRSQDQQRVLLVRDNVVFEKGGVSATGRDLFWDEHTGLARLKGEPPVLNRLAAREEGSQDSIWTTMTADSLDLRLQEDVLESILLHGPGVVTTITKPAPGSMVMRPDSTRVPAQPEHMVLKGYDIAITLVDESLEHLEATRAAMYYWREDVPERQSAMGGNELDVSFDGGEPSVVEARGNAVTRFFDSLDTEESGLQRAMAALIRLTLEDGELKLAYLENGNAWYYAASLVSQGLVPMAVHPDSIKVGARRRPPGNR